MAANLTFIMPGLLDPVPYLDQIPKQELPELPLFNKILSRGQWIRPKQLNDDPYGFYQTVINYLTGAGKQNSVVSTDLIQFLYAAEPQSNLSEIEHHYMMRVDPCIMLPDRDQLLLHPINDDDLSHSEAEQLVKEINAFYENITDDFQWTLYALSPNRWYLVCKQPIDLYTVPPETVLNQPVKKFLPVGNDSQYWLNLLNEFQMILHQSPVNQARTQAGKAAINSVWFWANGEIKGDHQEKYCAENQSAFYSNLSFVKGLASSCQQACFPLFESMSSVDFKLFQNYVVVIQDYQNAIKQKDWFQWLELLKHFEADYLPKIFDLLQQNTINQCQFISPTGRQLQINKQILSDIWPLSRLWQKPSSYQNILSNMD